jgi:hypothetical protein
MNTQSLADELGMEAEEVDEMLGEQGGWDYLMSFADDSMGKKSAQQFKLEWDKRFPACPVRVAANPHDFGTYYSVEVPMRAYRDEETFPKGPEHSAAKLADELGLEY